MVSETKIIKKIRSKGRKTAKREVNNYETTVKFLVGLKYFFEKDKKIKPPFSSVSLRRKFISKDGKEVTPDFMARLENEYGFIGEFKIGMPNDNSLFFKTLASINQYDNLQKGWREKPDTYDIGFFLYSKFLPRAKTILEKTEQNDQKFVYEKEDETIKIDLDHPFTLWRFTELHEQLKSFFQYEKVRGHLSHQKLEEFTNQDPILISISTVLDSLSEIRFSDAIPPPLYILRPLYEHIFNDITPIEDFRKKTGPGKTVVDIEFTLDDIDERLNAFTSKKQKRTKQVRKQTIKKAFKILKGVDLLKEKEEEKYEVHYDPNIEDPVEYVLDKIFGQKGSNKKKQGGVKENQSTLDELIE